MLSRIVVFNAVLLVACLYAVGRGGKPERWFAGMIAVAAAMTALRPQFTSIGYAVFNPAVGAVDALLLLGMTTLAARADRFWPIWAAGLQLLAMGIHAVRWLNPDLLPMVYNRSLGKIAYPIIALLVVGTFRHRRRLPGGEERDWSTLKW